MWEGSGYAYVDPISNTKASEPYIVLSYEHDGERIQLCDHGHIAFNLLVTRMLFSNRGVVEFCMFVP